MIERTGATGPLRRMRCPELVVLVVCRRSQVVVQPLGSDPPVCLASFLARCCSESRERMKVKEDLYTSSRSVVVSIGSLLLLGCTCATQSRFEAQAPALDLVQVD